jgi:DNA-binding HxlR family transcriptional regulator
MDYFERRILTALKEGKPESFTTLQSKVGFSHNTLQQHLTQLVENGLVLREKDPSSGFGRPKYAYYVPSKTVKQVAVALEDPDVELVTLPFSRVRHICRFEKGGWCKEKRRLVRLKFARKSENKTYHHFTPIKGQTSALLVLF